MKKLLLFLLVSLAVTLPALADPTTNTPSVTLAWDQHGDTNVIGYRLYWGTASRAYTNDLAVPGITNTTCVVSNLVRNTTYYFAATAYTASLESDYSVEVSYKTMPLPARPQNVRATTNKP